MHNLNPLISVIIPTHNRRDLLRKAIQSVIDQTYKNFEIIVVDNGSTDGTDEIIKNWNQPQIRYCWQEDSGGPASPRNKGIKLSKGEYIAFLDSDDLWLPEKLEKQISFMEKNKDYGMIFCNSYYFTKPGQTDGKVLCDEFVFDSSKQTETLIEKNVIPQLTVLFRRKNLLEVGFFDEDPEMKVVEDYDLFIRFSFKYRIGYLPETLAMLYRNEEGLSVGWNFYKARLKITEKLIKNHRDRLPKFIIKNMKKNRLLYTILGKYDFFRFPLVKKLVVAYEGYARLIDSFKKVFVK